MTRLVRDYIDDKVRKAVEGRRNELLAARTAAYDRHTDSERNAIWNEIYDSREYKALEAKVKKLFDKHGLCAEVWGGRKRLISLDCAIRYPDVQKADKAVEDFDESLRGAIRDALVRLELAKSMASVEDAIATAVASVLGSAKGLDSTPANG